jgi:hypothetical protein
VFVLDVDAMGAGIDVESLLPQETDQGDAGFFGLPDGQARGRTYSSYYSYASEGCFLDEFETGTAAEQEDRLGQRKPVLLPRVADEFVECVMAADVFAECEEPAFLVK